jgi:hypothetical protein
MKVTIGLLLVLAFAGIAAGDGNVIRNVPVIKTSTPVIDGVIGDGEYAAAFTDPGTGIEVRWQADSAVLHCALKSPGKGWLAIGFGSAGMNGAAMAFAAAGSDGKWTVEEQIGKSFFRHARADTARMTGAAALLQGKTVMEIAVPLALSNGRVISGTAPLPFILAYHKAKTAGGKHTKKSSGSMILARTEK